MVGEVTMICVDNGIHMTREWGDWFRHQMRAIKWYAEIKLKAHPDNLVGLVKTGAQHFGIALLPTRDLEKVMRVLTAVTPQWESINLLGALVVASDFGRFRHKNLKQRILVFAGNPLDSLRSDLKKTVKLVQGDTGVVVDVIDLCIKVKGQGRKTRSLRRLVRYMNKRNNNENGEGQYVCVPEEDVSLSISEYLSTSPIAPHPVAAAEGGNS